MKQWTNDHFLHSCISVPSSSVKSSSLVTMSLMCKMKYLHIAVTVIVIVIVLLCLAGCVTCPTTSVEYSCPQPRKRLRSLPCMPAFLSVWSDGLWSVSFLSALIVSFLCVGYSFCIPIFSLLRKQSSEQIKGNKKRRCSLHEQTSTDTFI